MTDDRSDRIDTSWSIERRRGDAAALHARDLGQPVRRQVSILDVDRASVVLGSAQRSDVVDTTIAAARGVDVVRRRGGGGAVWLSPGEQLWVDVVIPRTDPFWNDDVGRAFLWLGEVWAAALESVGMTAEVHTGPLTAAPWSDLVCFAGLGPGEVTSGGRKVVGISQRRTREGARFQSVVYAAIDLVSLAAVLDVSAVERERLVVEVGRRTAPAAVDLAVIESAFLARLPVSPI